MPTFHVLEVTPEPDTWTTEHGTFRTYRLRLQGQDKTVHLNQKAESAAPHVGGVLDLTLEPHPRFGDALKAKKAFVGGGPRGRDPKESRRIAVQHGQKCAVDILKLAADHGTYKPPETIGDLVAQVKLIAAGLLAQVEEVGA